MSDTTSGPTSEAGERPVARPEWLWRPGGPPLWIRLAIIGGLIAVVFWMARDLWFFDDDWDYLTERTGGDLDSYLRDHAAHWTLWTVPVFRLIYRVAGVDYFPWFHLPRFLACGVLALVLWRGYERRGASPLVAGAATAVFVVLDTSAGHRAVSIGNYIVIGALVVVGLRLVEHDPPQRRDLVVVAATLLIAVSAFSTGPILLAATTLVVLGTRRISAWWPSLVPPILLFAWWSSAYGPDRTSDLTAGDLVDAPLAMLDVLAQSMSSLFGFPTGVGTVVALGLIGLVAWWGWRRELDRFDALAVLTVVAFLFTTAVLRATADLPVVDRYAFVPIVASSLVVVPRLPRGSTLRSGALVAVLALALLAANLVGTRERTRELADTAAERRLRVEAAAALLADGEPAVDDSWVTVPLTVRGLRRLVADGWDPPLPAGLEEEARGLLRIGLGPDSASDELIDGDGPGCVRLERGDRVEFPIDGPAELPARAAPRSRIEVRWEEDGIVGERRIDWADRRGAFRGTDARFALAGPAGDGEAVVGVTVLQTDDAVVVCPPEA